jgi:hypothetical protein
MYGAFEKQHKAYSMAGITVKPGITKEIPMKVIRKVEK